MAQIKIARGAIAIIGGNIGIRLGLCKDHTGF